MSPSLFVIASKNHTSIRLSCSDGTDRTEISSHSKSNTAQIIATVLICSKDMNCYNVIKITKAAKVKGLLIFGMIY